MGDYVFLIIAILLSVFGALNQNKKRNSQENEREEPHPGNVQNDPFLNFELLEVEDEEQVYERKVRDEAKRAEFLRSVEAEKQKASQPTRFRTTLPDRPKKKVIKPTLKVLDLEEAAVVREEGGDSYLEDFSLRKAVIYSEILRPKY
jgi:hypothetical protein